MDKRRFLCPGAWRLCIYSGRYDELGARTDGTTGGGRAARGLSSYFILAVYGYSSGEAFARGPLERGQGALESLGLTEMRVLVTGHRGYIGSPLLDPLEGDGAARG